MGIIKEFKEFAVRGNVVDMAIGIIIGGAFGKVVTSLVNDIIMPPIGMILGGVDFTELKIMLSEDVAINYGAFINTVIDFVIVAFAIFMVIKGMNSMRKKEEKKSVVKECKFCKSSIPKAATRCPNCTSKL